MSKQPFDQQGDNKTPDDAASRQGASDTPPSDATSSVSPSTPAADKNAEAYAAKNSRSRRRNKGGSQSQPAKTDASANASTTTGTHASTRANTSTSADSTSPSPDKAPAGAASASNKPAPSNSKPSATTPPPKTPASSTPTPPSGGGKSGGKGGAVAIVLVVIVALILGVIAWQLWQRTDAQQARIDELAQQTQSSATQQSLDELQSRIESGESERNETLDSTVSELRGELESVQARVDETVSDVLDQLSQAQDTDERDWLHAEAAYLLRLANQRLQLEGDVEGASALLRTADARLVDADNPALTPIRREIANELAALDAVPRVDRTGIYLALNAQQEQIAGLRLSQEIEERAISEGMEQPPSGSFERQLAKFGAELRDLVVVRHHDEALEALITPEQESYLRQSLRLILEQAQLALLREEQPLFEASLDKALDLLERYYDTERDETQSVIARLEEIKQNQVEPELPDISGSQQAMADFIDNRFQARRQGGGDE
ncbi:uroporphyrinogen-III C-methyltransferase [Halomonas sp. PAMB 3232]|uniref:uroporphyrinogen-III C-methyltransferase n=1 Tax=Halomonas sp. PAMB 3232 TaxID=3075221 RepID=UPI00289E65AE|nr:uroporphyrinogen-III C-methyltransferase [Halomonas sp. PAMB 3232]WNL39095.1 uroporphyrinogen-III C-methyltransferase [Halomonas sp. PAMB 3232]